MQRNSAFLLDQVRSAITNTQNGIKHSAKDTGEGEPWTVLSQTDEQERMTGKVVVTCTVYAVVRELEAELQEKGHTVEPLRNRTTGALVPSGLIITPRG